MTDLPGELGRVFCERTLEEWGYTLERYALHSVDNCPDRPVRLVFDSDIQLTAPEITISDGLLRLDAHFRSADDYLLSATPSPCMSLIRAQASASPREIPASALASSSPSAVKSTSARLPPGEYELRVALYDWQTGERLLARGLETGRSQRHAHAAALPPRLKRKDNTHSRKLRVVTFPHLRYYATC